jgi:hypothetical protein
MPLSDELFVYLLVNILTQQLTLVGENIDLNLEQMYLERTKDLLFAFPFFLIKLNLHQNYPTMLQYIYDVFVQP